MGASIFYVVVPAALWIFIRDLSHWPVNFASAASFLARVVLPMLGMGGWLLVMANLGRFVLGRFLEQDFPRALRLGIFITGGLGLWGILVQIMCLAGWISPSALAASAGLAALFSIFGFSQIREEIRELHPLLPVRWIERACAVIVISLLWHSAASALSPALDGDTLAYHLAIPKNYIREGSARFIPWYFDANFPFLSEMHHLTGLVFGWEFWGSLTQVASAAILVMMIVEVFNRLFTRPVGWLAAALLCSMPVMLLLAGSGRTDSMLALFSVCTFILGCHAKDCGRASIAFAAGIFAGFSSGVKYLGLFQVLWLAMLLFPRPALFGFSMLGAGLSGGLWYIRNFLWTGNPVYPFAYKLFGGPFWSEEVAGALWRMCTWDGMGFTWLHFFAQPFYWIFYPAPYQYQPQYFAIPMLVLMPFVLWRLKKWGLFAKRALALSGLYYLFLFPNGEVWRFMLPVWPWVCGFLAAAACALFATKWKSLSLILLVGFYPAVWISEKGVLDYLKDSRSSATARDDFLLKNLDSHPAISWMNQNLLASSKVLFFRDNRIFYSNQTAISSDPLGQTWIPLWPSIDPSRLYRLLKERGITHIYIHRGLLISRPSRRYYTPELLASMETVLQGHSSLLFHHGFTAVYQLR